MKKEKIYIYGKHAVTEAIQNSPKSLKKVFLADEKDGQLMSIIHKNNIPYGKFGSGDSAGDVDRNSNHQGVIGLIMIENLVQDYDSFIKDLEITKDTCLVVMDELQDPQNVGAIIRSSAALGISGVLMPEHNQAPITGSVVKVSAGMAFRLPLVRIGNINNTLRDLQKRGFWVYGLDGNADHSINVEPFDAPTVFVLGNEGAGIHEHTKKLCDIMLSIPMNKRCESMNVASSTAIALYAWSAKHGEALN